MADDAKEVLEGLEKLIVDIPLPEKMVKVIRGLIELRTIVEITEAFNARQNELALNLAQYIAAMESGFPDEND